jgi:uncharacterized protein (TIGR03083 family)
MRPTYTAHLFGPLHAELIALLRSLTPEQWLRPTIAGRWRVRDVAAHLLDGALRKVAVYRDGHVLPLEAPIASAEDLTRLVNSLNAGGVAFARRLSTRQLVDLLEMTGGWANALVADLPPHGRAIWAVSWAGEDESVNWMDTGREYTERWHHQMQIRDAVGTPLLLEPRWLDPLLDISVRALPVAYAGVDAPEGTCVRFAVEGDPPRAWTLTRTPGRWALDDDTRSDSQCIVTMSGDTSWRLLFNALPADEARRRLTIHGDPSLAEPLLAARSVIV